MNNNKEKKQIIVTGTGTGFNPKFEGHKDTIDELISSLKEKIGEGSVAIFHSTVLTADNLAKYLGKALGIKQIVEFQYCLDGSRLNQDSRKVVAAYRTLQPQTLIVIPNNDACEKFIKTIADKMFNAKDPSPFEYHGELEKLGDTAVLSENGLIEFFQITDVESNQESELVGENLLQETGTTLTETETETVIAN